MRNKIINFFVIYVSCLICFGCENQNQKIIKKINLEKQKANAINLKEEMYKVLKSFSSESLNTSMLVEDLNGRRVFDLNTKAQGPLASLQKIKTLSFVKENFVKGFQFKTSLGIAGDDLVLIPSGDPTLTHKDLIDLFWNFKLRTNKTFKKIAINISSLGIENTTNDLKKVELFNPIYGSLNINENMYYIYKLDDYEIRKYSLNIFLANFYKELTNKYKAVDTKSTTQTDLNDLSFLMKERIYRYSYPIIDLKKAVEELILLISKQLGFGIETIEFVEKIPTNTEILSTHESESIENIISYALKESNTLVTQVLYALASKKSATEKYDDPIGLDIKTEDSCESLVSFIKKNDFIQHFAVSGISGTIKNRLKNHKTYIAAKAKTGTLNYVKNLAGAFVGKSNKMYYFCIMINDKGNSGSYKYDWKNYAKSFSDELLSFWIEEL